MNSNKIKLGNINIEEVEATIKQFIVENVLKNEFQGGIIGLSGGVDSTLSATFAKLAFDEYNQANGTDLKLKGYILPSKINASADENDAIDVANKLGIEYEIVEVEPLAKAFDKAIPDIRSKKYDRGNLLSRIRANVLHTFSALENKLVIGTGNYDEDYCLGYYTLFGDGAVHISPIGSLSKRHVRELALNYGFDKIAIREPTAGLEVGQTDFGDLGYSYEMAELVIEGKDQGFSVEELKEHKQVVDMFNVFKDRSKYDNTSQVVDDIMKRHKIALKKAKLVSPSVCNIQRIYL